ncbi:hypothetical protein GLOIN_2v1761745 [Rhizophagus irregularis DAOM 181602=DAOM 197198]|nr:hypothetical protein GLOIN_2v1761745 [Rhizophagus irregularis DAOM 181602=DAOM 197198]
MSESQQREKIGIGSMVISFMLEIIVITQLYSMDDMLIMVAIRSEQFLEQIAERRLFEVDPESYQCLIIYHGGEKDYFLCENTYDGKVYDELIVLAESCISSSFEGRDKITPDDDYKIRKKAGCLY